MARNNFNVESGLYLIEVLKEQEKRADEILNEITCLRNFKKPGYRFMVTGEDIEALEKGGIIYDKIETIAYSSTKKSSPQK